MQYWEALMLTSLQHQFAPRIADPQKRRAYTTHMCGVCHALGDHYGLLSRLLTTHELILLNLLTDAQCQEAPTIIARRCPLNPLLQVKTNQNIASGFAAAVAVELANVKFADDIQDSGGRDGVAHLARWLVSKPHQAALQALAELGFKTETLTRLNERQRLSEADETQDAAEPSAITSAQLFALTARLAGTPHNAEPLAVIGAHFGAYIYLLDAYRDFARDMAQGDYNPLRRFSESSAAGVTLSQAGRVWLLRRFEKMRAAIRLHLPQLQLYRYHDLLTDLLCEPLDKLVLELSQPLRQQCKVTVPQWSWSDVFKAGLFVLPMAAASTGFVWARKAEQEQQRRESRDRSPCDYSDLCYCYDGRGCGYCSDLRGCEGCGQGVDTNSCQHCGQGVDVSACGQGADANACGHCGNVDCSGIDCSGIDCSGVDCSGADCGGCN
jgi:hypothetical protein